MEAKRGLVAHAVAYVMVNLLLAAIWYVSSADFFWTVFPVFGWGIGLAFHAWDVLWPAAGEERSGRRRSGCVAPGDRLRRAREDGGCAPATVSRAAYGGAC